MKDCKEGAWVWGNRFSLFDEWNSEITIRLSWVVPIRDEFAVFRLKIVFIIGFVLSPRHLKFLLKFFHYFQNFFIKIDLL